jgi:hypothetical protein
MGSVPRTGAGVTVAATVGITVGGGLTATGGVGFPVQTFDARSRSFLQRRGNGPGPAAAGDGEGQNGDQQSAHDQAPTAKTRQAATPATQTREVGRKIFQPSRIS